MATAEVKVGYIEKKRCQVGEKVAISVLYSAQMRKSNPIIFWLDHLSVVRNIVKEIYFQDHIQEFNIL